MRVRERGVAGPLMTGGLLACGVVHQELERAAIFIPN
jgi:hypothetical protein